MNGTERLIALGLMLAAIVLSGVVGCTANSTYQFRVGNYCNRPHMDAAEWIKCDLLKETR